MTEKKEKETLIEAGYHEAGMRYTRGQKTDAAGVASWRVIADNAWIAAFQLLTSLYRELLDTNLERKKEDPHEDYYLVELGDSSGVAAGGTQGYSPGLRLMEGKTDRMFWVYGCRLACGGREGP